MSINGFFFFMKLNMIDASPLQELSIFSYLCISSFSFYLFFCLKLYSIILNFTDENIG